MTLNELLQNFISSDTNEWDKIACWGNNGAPTYKNQFNHSASYESAYSLLTSKEHSNVASLKSNSAINIAWGIQTGDQDDIIDKKWARNCSDDSPGQQYFLDFFYNGHFLFRASYCMVDGGKCALPFPNYDVNKNVTVPKMYHDLIKKFTEIKSSEDFDYYFNKSGISISNDKWIV